MRRFIILSFLLNIVISFTHSISLPNDYDFFDTLFQKNNSIDPCDNPLRYSSCKHLNYHEESRNIEKVYTNIRNKMIDVLSQPPSEHEVKTLSVEKQLFQACLNLDNKENPKSNSELNDYFFNKIMKATDIPHWSKREMSLNDLGLPFNFFDISVEQDVDNLNKNIITLSPPSFMKSYTTAALVKDALKNFRFNKPEDLEYRKIFDLSLEDKNSITDFFAEWLKIFCHNPESNHDCKTTKTSLLDWELVIQRYIKKMHLNNRMMMLPDYYIIIPTVFAKNNITIGDSEPILIKDLTYFLHLNNLLYKYSTVIYKVMKVKLLTENLRYLDWKKAEFLGHKKRSIFCFEDTKLYGASFKFIRDTKKDLEYLNPNYKMIENILSNIVDATIVGLSHSKIEHNLLEYLKADIQLITTKVINHNKFRDSVSRYYDGYELTNSYFVDIIKYRTFIKAKELSTLRDLPSHLNIDTVPFSINELNKSRNKFALSSVVLLSPTLSNNLPKEIYYGMYGATMAAILVGLLSEHRDKQNENLYEDHNRFKWMPNPEYTTEVLKCFNPDTPLTKKNKPMATDVVSEVFGIRIAYKALLKDYLESNEHRMNHYGNEIDYITGDQLFFLAYLQKHCSLDENWTKTIFQDLNEFAHAFNCYGNNNYKPSKCHLTLADVVYNPFSLLVKNFTDY